MRHLAERHRIELEDESSILREIISERGYFTAESADTVPNVFADYQRRPGLVIPIRGTTGTIAGWQLKADEPRLDKNDEPVKYDTATGARQCLDVPLRSRPHLGKPSVPLWITEGAKKVDAGVAHGIRCIIGVQGVYGWRGTNGDGGKTALPDWEDIALNGRDVVLAFDSDVMTKDKVRDALDRLSAFLRQRGAAVRYLLLPSSGDEETVETAKTGLDDYFAEGHTLAEVEALIVDRLPTAEQEWSTPLSLDDPCGPPFPMEALPAVAGAFAAALTEETQTPPDMAATVALGTISAAAGGTYEVVIPEQGWVEPVHGQFVVVAEPASRKSAVIREATEPIRAYEREMQPGDRRALAEWESQLRVLEKRLASAENEAARASDKRALTDGMAVRMAAAEELETHRSGGLA